MKSLLMLISVFALVISLVSAQASATQCNDGIDNDEDGKTDALVVNTQTQTPRITQDVSHFRCPCFEKLFVNGIPDSHSLIIGGNDIYCKIVIHLL